jgi:hypothetical protein
MGESFPLEPYREGIAQVTTDVFETMLASPVRPTGGDGICVAGSFTAAVYYSGTWQGALLVECSQEQAMNMAARLMA